MAQKNAHPTRTPPQRTQGMPAPVAQEESDQHYNPVDRAVEKSFMDPSEFANTGYTNQAAQNRVSYLGGTGQDHGAALAALSRGPVLNPSAPTALDAAGAGGPRALDTSMPVDRFQYDINAGAGSRDMQMAALAGMQDRPQTAGLQMSMARDAAMQQAMAQQAGARGVAPGAAMRAGLQGLQPGLAQAASVGMNTALTEQAAQQSGVRGIMGQVGEQDIAAARQQEAMRQSHQAQTDALIDRYLRLGMNNDQAAMRAQLELAAMAQAAEQAQMDAESQQRSALVGAFGTLAGAGIGALAGGGAGAAMGANLGGSVGRAAGS